MNGCVWLDDSRCFMFGYFDFVGFKWLIAYLGVLNCLFCRFVDAMHFRWFWLVWLVVCLAIYDCGYVYWGLIPWIVFVWWFRFGYICLDSDWFDGCFTCICCFIILLCLFVVWVSACYFVIWFGLTFIDCVFLDVYFAMGIGHFGVFVYLVLNGRWVCLFTILEFLAFEGFGFIGWRLFCDFGDLNLTVFIWLFDIVCFGLAW